MNMFKEDKSKMILQPPKVFGTRKIRDEGRLPVNLVHRLFLHKLCNLLRDLPMQVFLVDVLLEEREDSTKSKVSILNHVIRMMRATKRVKVSTKVPKS